MNQLRQNANSIYYINDRKSIAHNTAEELISHAFPTIKAYVMATIKKGKKVVRKGEYDVGIILAGDACFGNENNIGPTIKLPRKPLR